MREEDYSSASLVEIVVIRSYQCIRSSLLVPKLVDTNPAIARHSFQLHSIMSENTQILLFLGFKVFDARLRHSTEKLEPSGFGPLMSTLRSQKLQQT